MQGWPLSEVLGWSGFQAGRVHFTTGLSGFKCFSFGLLGGLKGAATPCLRLAGLPAHSVGTMGKAHTVTSQNECWAWYPRWSDPELMPVRFNTIGSEMK